MPKQIKIAFIGDSGVGKTSLINYSLENECVTNDEPTNLVDRTFKKIKLDESSIINFGMWDFSGKIDSFKIRTELYPELHAIAYCFDLSNKNTFQNLENWIKEVKNYKGDKLISILLGLKCDKSKVIDFGAIQRFSEKYKMNYFEISIKDINSVRKFFVDYGRILFDYVKTGKK